MSLQAFRPRGLVRHRDIQTVLPSLYRGTERTMREAAEEMILTVLDGVRLKGFYSPQRTKQAKGLVLLHHGWLGSADSHYVVTVGECLYEQGYSVFRLNRRDHGDTEYLNPGLYRGDLLEEVFEATRQVARLEPDRPLHLAGASMGGNFAMRLAWRHSQEPLPNLGQTVAISPGVDPYQVAMSLDSSWSVYLAYFRRKWRKTFRQKKAAYPDLYDDISEVMAAWTTMEMTNAFARRYTEYADAAEYFGSYTVTRAMMADLCTPTTILAANDDPIVPVQTLYPFEGINPHLQVHFQSYGGHCGFLDVFPRRPWMCQATLETLKAWEEA